MRDRVLRYIHKHVLMLPGDRVGVAVSGGADSVGMLRLLLEARAELGIVLSIVHFNHKIRGADADADERFVAELAQNLELEFHCESEDTPASAADKKMSLEAAARDLRYAFFDHLTGEQIVQRVATAHTRNDQAETVLMRFLRGAGTKGLVGIRPGMGGWISMGTGGKLPQVPPGPRIVRPLLEITREELRAYLRSLGQSWREDASNADTEFTRNRLRHEILPILRQLNPNLDEVLSETAEIAREEESWWNQQASTMQQGLWASRRVGVPEAEHFKAPRMLVDALLSMPIAVQRRLIRMMTEGPNVSLGFRHVEAVRELAASEPSRSEKIAQLPNGLQAVRAGGELWFRRGCQNTWGPSRYDLALKVGHELAAAGGIVRARLVCGEDLQPERAAKTSTTRVLLPAFLAKAQFVRVRNWNPGDRYWPAHTKEPKKLKELLQAPHVPRPQKDRWPVVLSGEEIIWVPGFPAPERFRVPEIDREALLLEYIPAGGAATK